MPEQFVAEEAGERLDVAVARLLPALTRSRAQRLIRDGQITVNGQPAKSGLRLEAGDRVAIEVPAAMPIAAQPEAIALDVLYEDGDLVVVNKPAGMTVHPAPGHPDGTLVNALLGRLPDLSGIGGALRPGIVHRLDKDTSGLLIVAKSDRAHLGLSEQIAEHAVEKDYLAVVAGQTRPAGVIDAPLGRHPVERQRMAVLRGGRPARTHFRALAPVGENTLVLVRLETGRTHQIRVHFATTGHPLLGDAVYGRHGKRAPRQLLHAWRLRFRHPVSGATTSVEAPLPDDLWSHLADAWRANEPDVEHAIERVLQSARRQAEAFGPFAAVGADAAPSSTTPPRRPPTAGARRRSP